MITNMTLVKDEEHITRDKVTHGKVTRDRVTHFAEQLQNRNHFIARSHHEGDIFCFSHSKGRLCRLRRNTQYKSLAGEILDTEFIAVYVSVIPS